ncbi:tripartite tricarboxylate transporter substrate binding protein [Variovorax arabinosiphilus]|uniref:tripartite tricarboxylate transporter substrate binding protein n=1 Tax=Variovorax arabinosiphilus TaxID=3053498 RepID=UPI002574F5BB|nr:MULTISPECIES: tripartite tricarboxylate transporter substrate binding protein [unclassified Variovorax]MDM0119703.1 tripartite tricarboxylate transporter substrate binding protein [Variovorax sp. J2L1-78]MDM0128385.1 tripartite tricarboxylate transporter substrate binding protein [Variovorax sp. J2L1-63]MDM0232085.1 tripartite tricarboxylate transporter substrate binding protein [Variovorax sp. J2R1-6]
MHAIRFPSRRRLLAAAGAALCLAVPAFAQTQAYPTKPVKLVVPYPPGGPTDIVARLVAQKLSDAMGQQFIVDNRPGAGGNPGAELVARSPADGYTLVVATTAHAINPSLFKNLGYSLSKDFAPVSQLTSGPLVIVANPQLPAKNVAELIALAKARPGELNFASSGNGQSTHLSAELFAAMAGVKMNHIPYKGSAPALTDTMGGQTQLMFDTMLSAMPHVKAGKLKALAVTSATRSPVAPDLPTVAESGLPGYEAIAWNGLLAPAGTPPEVLARLSAELKKVLAAPDVKDKFEAQGFAASWNSPEDFGRFMSAEVDKWAKVVKVSGAKVD